ncbi:MAG: hypothetical protein IJW97_01810 [Clostridia bacterium]|nr:hypothetical protein [Clostridia bacterium]
MKSNLLRALLLLLALILCLGTVACATPDEEDPEEQPGEDLPEEEEPKEPEEPRVFPDVPEEMLDFEMNVLHYTIEGNHEGINPWYEICPEEGIDSHIGDLIADDIFDRAAWIEENYGVTLTCTYMSYLSLPTTVSSLVSSGSDEYHLVDDFGHGSILLFGKNYFLNIADIDYIDFENPWWVDGAIDALSIGDYVEFTASDMLILDKGATAMMFYNIPMATDLGITELYDDVRNYEWTIEKLAEYAELGLRETGNDILDHNDIYGIANGDDPVTFLYYGAGKRLVNFDGDEFYYEYGSSEDTFDIMITILDEIMYADFFWNGWLTRNEVQGDDQPSFKEDEALFNFGMAKNCNSLRAMESSYGILPIPMYDEYQSIYYSQVSPHHDSLFAVPMSVKETDLPKLGATLELLGYYSYYEVYPDFYDVVIQGRGTRDAESKEMLEIAFANRTYDLGLIYDPVNFADKVLRYTQTGNSNVASFFEQYQTQLETAMEDLNTMLEELN